MIAWSIHRAGIEDQIHYIDDFLFLGPLATDVAARALSFAFQILDHPGFPVAMHKTEGPTCCIMFLGIILTLRHSSCGYQQRNSINCRHF